MIVEIFGAGFHNQGAELMLRTVFHELGSRMANCQPALDVVHDPDDLLSDMGPIRLFPPRHNLGRGFRGRFRRQKLFARLYGGSIGAYGLETIAASDAFVDIAGFYHSDQWGQPVRTKNYAVLTRFYHLRGRPVILLPQAFGPFENPELRCSFRKVLNNCDLVYARDRQSFDYIGQLAPDPERIHLAPDITFFYPEPQAPEVPDGDSYVCIVPNARMLDQGSDIWGDKYEHFLQQMGRSLIADGVRVRLLAHESTGEDAEIIARLRAALASRLVDVVEGLRPLQLKEIIWGSLFVVGSRYHSLVAAFSGSVPSICMGWSHKYEMLYKDFGCSELLIQPDHTLDRVETLLKKLRDPAENRGYRSLISSRLDTMRHVNEEMWQRVVQVLQREMDPPASRIVRAMSLLE